MRRALCALFFFALVNTAVGGEATPAKRVLMLSTGNRVSIGFPIVEQNAVDKLRQLRPGELEFYSEYLDIVRFPSEKHRQIFRDYLQQKYAEDIPDLIILICVGNLNVAQMVLGSYFQPRPLSLLP